MSEEKKIVVRKNFLKRMWDEYPIQMLLIIGGAYLLSPIDLVPEFIPVIGFIDDLIVGGASATTIIVKMIQMRKENAEIKKEVIS